MTGGCNNDEAASFLRLGGVQRAEEQQAAIGGIDEIRLFQSRALMRDDFPWARHHAGAYPHSTGASCS